MIPSWLIRVVSLVTLLALAVVGAFLFYPFFPVSVSIHGKYKGTQEKLRLISIIIKRDFENKGAICDEIKTFLTKKTQLGYLEKEMPSLENAVGGLRDFWNQPLMVDARDGNLGVYSIGPNAIDNRGMDDDIYQSIKLSINGNNLREP